MIEVDLSNHLKNDAEVSSLVGTRIYPKVAPQNAGTPYIVYHVINGNNKQCLGGGIYQKDVRFQLDCWDERYSKVVEIKEAVISSLNGFKSSYGISSTDDYESETELYRQIIDFKLKD